MPPRVFAGILLAVSVTVLVYGAVAPQRIERVCFLQATAGVPCPLCGGTRAVSALLHGHVLTAVAHHAVVALLVPVMFIFGAAGIALPSRSAAVASMGYTALGLAGWAWLAYYVVRVLLVLIGDVQ